MVRDIATSLFNFVVHTTRYVRGAMLNIESYELHLKKMHILGGLPAQKITKQEK